MGDDDEVFVTRSRSTYAEDNGAAFYNGKSEAKIIMIEDCTV